MKFALKILVLFIFIFILQVRAIAGSLTVQNFSSPIKIANKISQSVNINFVSDGVWKLLVESLDNRAVNQDYPQYSIPINRIELAEVGGNPIANFDSGRIIEIKNGQNIGTTNFNLALNAALVDSDRPGNYVADVKFTLFNQNAIVAEEIFCFRFRQEEISSIEFSQNVISHTLDKEKSLEKNCSQNIPTPLGLYISSNKDWKLYVRKISDSNDNNLKYYFKVIGGDSTISLNKSSEYVFLNYNPILVASGKSTINTAMNCLDKKLITMGYMIKGPEQDFIPVGSYSDDIEYRLETED